MFKIICEAQSDHSIQCRPHPPSTSLFDKRRIDIVALRIDIGLMPELFEEHTKQYQLQTSETEVLSLTMEKRFSNFSKPNQITISAAIENKHRIIFPMMVFSNELSEQDRKYCILLLIRYYCITT